MGALLDIGKENADDADVAGLEQQLSDVHMESPSSANAEISD